jgi:hypothetical protein
MRTLFSVSLALLCVLLLGACQSPDWKRSVAARPAMLNAIASEEPGSYFIGRRFYKSDYRFWGYVRSPRRPWSTSQLVMFNEHSKLAPDRELGNLGADNGYEYRLEGFFSGDTVYEPASNRFYPEFVLKGYELRASAPAAIYRTAMAMDPESRVIPKPY